MTADLFLAVTVAVVVLAVFVAVVLAGRRVLPAGGVPDQRMTAFETRLDRVSEKLDATTDLAKAADHGVRNIRMELRSVATKDAVNDVKVGLGELRGEVKAVTQTTTSMQHSLDRVENFLMSAAAERVVGLNSIAGNGDKRT